MAIHWQIPFKSLRSGTVYTVNIHDASYSGNPITLNAGAHPFVTQEDDDAVISVTFAGGTDITFSSEASFSLIALIILES